MFSCIFRDKNVYKYLFNGDWTESHTGRTIRILSPVDKSVVGEIQAMSTAEVDRSIKNASDAQKKWAGVPMNKRAEVLNRAADLLEREIKTLSHVIMKEIAKRKTSAEEEVIRSAEYIRYTAEEGRRMTGETLYSDVFPGYGRNKILVGSRVPLGVVLAISPFNYPVNLAVSKIAPALISGNAVVFKPATQGSISALHLVRVFCEAGVPAGVLNVITGKGSEIGDFSVTHPFVNMIAFTGGSENGIRIAKAAGMVPMLMELGGKDAAIVLEDCDVEDAAGNIVSGAFSYSGQRCTAVKRILVMEPLSDTLVGMLAEKIKRLRVGLPEDDADITPLIDETSADYVEGLIDDAVEKGARLIPGYRREGTTIYPALLDNVTPDMRIAWAEPFGPVLPVMRVKSDEEAIYIANKSEYGLQSSIFTRDINRAFNIAERLEVGTVQINGKTERGPDHFPFIGVKSSGMGTQGVKYTIEAMTRAKAIVINIKK